MTGVPASAAGSGPVAKPKAAVAVRQVSLWNIANILTMIRLLLVPGFVALMLADGGDDPKWRAFAWAAFTVAMITDLFDGELARRYDLVTDFGKLADPIADKAIMGAALVCLSALGDLHWWVTVVILVRELGITAMRFWVIRHGVIPASRGGKVKTLTQGVAVGMYVLALTGPLASLRWWVMGAAVLLTVGTGADYVRQAVVLRRAGLAAEKAVVVVAAEGTLLADGTVVADGAVVAEVAAAVVTPEVASPAVVDEVESAVGAGGEPATAGEARDPVDGGARHRGHVGG
ncbi:CDP-diacylglycerol--glycerol-3-phosphate 3-phosphatidyltransferase [Streptomyces sp. Z26]|uniref:CDP-diacylglycerol--glycerol-3-phosphate 3-phosphatidyltransferase n=1 Tax=Streptomyces sp. Z26 TaxID=2500177 RepID=UPI001F0C171F|nr:CDP-diacylglycerol--glycerol-3-phosphate 3-phosphatidyltransferase [Streptomyces sp. Z26]